MTPLEGRKKILITGGAGFVASAMAEKLAANPDNHVVIADNLLTGDMKKVPTSVHNNIEFLKIGRAHV